jgi:hypothetical protein
MNNTNAILNRVEILFFSTLTSGMSRLDQLRARLQRAVSIPINRTHLDNPVSAQLIEDGQEESLPNPWLFLRQALIPLGIWIVLGFAAGFLIGMIRPG